MPAKYREVEINDLRLIALNTENIYLTKEKQTDGTATTAITGVLPHAKLGRFSGHLSIYHPLIKIHHKYMRPMCIAQKNVLYFKKIPLSFCVVRIAGSKHYIHKSGLIVSHIISTRMFLDKKVRKARLLVFWLQKTTMESLQFFLRIFKQESINSC